MVPFEGQEGLLSGRLLAVGSASFALIANLNEGTDPSIEPSTLLLSRGRRTEGVCLRVLVGEDRGDVIGKGSVTLPQVLVGQLGHVPIP